ncbi:hypothetical protein ACFQI7_32780 [Paenibacillus allorhizosphaerae]|uniref:Myb-like domain-containing protein n=1 Tax=Paenibacillus allorhizosphaerae TaxID=2849866 RepID=A0ABN7TX08_9BACL|nr:hypothetical protein [Paenibacillus allorhizosphaerae]CAG7658931.1 hypothetical protein PAECIP111802_07220 [Paenibacillus allorhizosphaerae]
MSEVKTKYEVWSPEQDQLLLQTVLKHLGNGSSQKKAFEEAADKIGRTQAACAFRFNAVLRQQHNEEILSVSHKKGNQLTSSMVIPFPNGDVHGENKTLNWQQVLDFLNSQALEVQIMQQQLNEIAEENRSLKEELANYKEVHNKLESFGMNISKMLELYDRVQ